MNRNELKKRAEKIVFDIEKIDPDSRERIVECEAGEITTYPSTIANVFRGQIAVLEQYTDMNVRLDSRTGALVGWSIPRHERGADSTLIDAAAAQELVSKVIDIPPDAQLLEITFSQEPGAHIATVMWQHLVNDIEVENDCVIALVNSATRQVISVSKIWNDIIDHADIITQEQALEIAKKELPAYATSKDAAIITAGRKFIPLVSENEPGKPLCRYVKVWTVIIDESDPEFTRTATLSIDTQDGKIVRVETSL